VRVLSQNEIAYVSGAGEYLADEIVVTARRIVDSGGSLWGNFWFALGLGAQVGGGGGESSGSGGVGLGGGFGIGYSSDSETAKQEGDRTQLQTPADIEIIFDLDPFTIGIQFNSGVYQPFAESHRVHER
jgi:hypothetical protein